MICRDPKQVDIFQNFDHFNYAYIRRPRTIRRLTLAVLERSLRKYLPPRAGATHALRVHSS